ncbi:MAG: hypothetical protein ACJATP_002690 [Candidatus Azotimanducaceae bacterium]|jgi:hypothetical protein
MSVLSAPKDHQQVLLRVFSTPALAGGACAALRAGAGRAPMSIRTYSSSAVVGRWLVDRHKATAMQRRKCAHFTLTGRSKPIIKSLV